MRRILLLAALAFTAISTQAQTMFVDTSSSIYEYNNGVLSGTFVSGQSGLGFMAFDNFGNLYADSGSNIIKFANNDGVLSTTSSVVVTGLKYPLTFWDGIAFDSNNNMYISDSGETNSNTVTMNALSNTAIIYQFTYNSTTKGFNQSTLSNAWFGTAAAPYGQLLYDDGSLYAANWYNGSVLKLGVGTGPGPSTITTIAGPPAADDAEGVAVDADGNTYVSIVPVLVSGGSILKYTPSGTNSIGSTFASSSTNSKINVTRSLGFDDNGDLWATVSNNFLEFVNTDGVLSSTPIVRALSGANALAFQPAALPEPSTVALGVLGLAVLGGWALKKRRAQTT